jgi:hypothetical protein
MLWILQGTGKTTTSEIAKILPIISGHKRELFVASYVRIDLGQP